MIDFNEAAAEREALRLLQLAYELLEANSNMMPSLSIRQAIEALQKSEQNPKVRRIY